MSTTIDGPLMHGVTDCSIPRTTHQGVPHAGTDWPSRVKGSRALCCARP